jgi:hypothetical protein
VALVGETGFHGHVGRRATGGRQPAGRAQPDLTLVVAWRETELDPERPVQREPAAAASSALPGLARYVSCNTVTLARRARR